MGRGGGPGLRPPPQRGGAAPDPDALVRRGPRRPVGGGRPRGV